MCVLNHSVPQPPVLILNDGEDSFPWFNMKVGQLLFFFACSAFITRHLYPDFLWRNHLSSIFVSVSYLGFPISKCRNKHTTQVWQLTFSFTWPVIPELLLEQALQTVLLCQRQCVCLVLLAAVLPPWEADLNLPEDWILCREQQCTEKRQPDQGSEPAFTSCWPWHLNEPINFQLLLKWAWSGFLSLWVY